MRTNVIIRLDTRETEGKLGLAEAKCRFTFRYLEKYSKIKIG